MVHRCVLGLLLSLLILPASGRSQGPIAPPRPLQSPERNYQNSAEGLRWQLQDIISSARDQSRDRMDSLIHQTEIPYSSDWFVQAFGREKGQTWAQFYEQNLAGNEKQFADTMLQLSQEDGEFSTRAIFDDPAPARKIEREMVAALQRPIDIYFASWRKRGLPADSASLSIGYFVFLGGRFRLDSAISYADMQLEPATEGVKPSGASPVPSADSPPNTPAAQSKDRIFRPGADGIGYPSCKDCADPPYSRLARDNGLEGTIILQVIIQPDGSVTDIQVIKSPDPELTRMAVDGVTNWHMNPARRADGEPVPVWVPIEITFRLAKSKRS